MPNFPKKEFEIVALAKAMAAGYKAHATDFPSANSAGLIRFLDEYNLVKAAHSDTTDKAQIDTEMKNLRLNKLIEIMRNELKKSEADVGSDSEKLKYIGWGP